MCNDYITVPGPTLKLKRRVAVAKHEAVIEAMYSEAPPTQPAKQEEGGAKPEETKPEEGGAKEEKQEEGGEGGAKEEGESS